MPRRQNFTVQTGEHRFKTSLKTPPSCIKTLERERTLYVIEQYSQKSCPTEITAYGNKNGTTAVTALRNSNDFYV